MNKTVMILSVSAVALLTVSQVALAREPFKKDSSSAISRTLILQKPILNQQKPINPASTGATNALNKGLTGVVTGAPNGTGFKGPGGNSWMPSGSAGKIGAGVGGIKGSIGQAKGVEAKDTISSKLAPGMIGAIRADQATKGKEKGVQQSDGISAKHAPGMIRAINDAAASRGQEKGVQANDNSYRLTPGQLQQMKDMTVNPKINPVLGAINFKDEKGDGKGGHKPAPKPSGTGTPKPTGDAKPAPKPATPKPTGGTTAGTKTPKPAGGGAKVGVVNPKTGTGTSKTPGAKVLSGGKLIVFDPVKITPKPKPGPLDGTFPRPKDPKKLEVISSPAMDRLQ